MMSTESVLNQMILTAITIIVTYYVFYFMLKLRLPFTYRTKTYANLSLVLKYGGQFVANTLVAITATAISYYTIKTSFSKISDFKNEEVATLFIIMLGIMIVGLNWRAILMFGRFLNHLCLYISLKKNNVSNNLRHAIANKNEQAIIENYKLIKKTDIKVNLSKEETIVLTACLSKHGFNEDIKQMLAPVFYKEQSLMNSFLTRNTDIIEHNVKGLDNSFKPSEAFKYKLKSYEKKAINISYIFIIVFGIQLFFLVFSDMLNISIAIKSMLVLFINLLVIILILVKHSKLKNIYKKEIEYNNLSVHNIKIRKPLVDNILLGLSVFMIIIRCIELIV
ncbi:TPA: hypothetical protein O1284_002760 [Staphylococcus aureus]|nr:hypothetical protein [Staphylococcus aureus]